MLRAGGASVLVGLGACAGARPEVTAATTSTTSKTAAQTAIIAAAAAPEALFRLSNGPYIDAAQAGVPTGGGGDVTAALQKALAEAAGGVLHVPSGRYRVNADPASGGSLRPASDTTIAIDPGAVIEVIPNGVDFSYLFRLEGVERVSITGGTLVGDREKHTSNTGEQGHLIAVFNSKDVRISNLTVTEAWGDGILIGYADNPGTESRRVVVDAVRAVGNRRLGLSVIGGIDIEIAHSTFAANAGTAPGAGIDIEPEPGFEVSDVVIHSCRFTGNEGDGLLLGGLASDGAISDVTIAGCVSERNGIDGVACFSAQRILVEGLVTRSNTKAGLSMNGVSDSTVNSLISTENGEQGLLSDPGVTNLKVIGATVTGNQGSGVSLRGESSKVRLGSGLVAQNGDVGIDLSRTDDVSIDSVTLDANLGGEIFIDSCADTVLHGCVVSAHDEATGPAIVSSFSRDTHIVANQLRGNGKFIVSATGEYEESAVIVGNTLWGTTKGGLSVERADVRENVVI
jgi:hypothetical protein